MNRKTEGKTVSKKECTNKTKSKKERDEERKKEGKTRGTGKYQDDFQKRCFQFQNQHLSRQQQQYVLSTITKKLKT